MRIFKKPYSETNKGVLFKAGDYDTAGYLIGYVVECSLKAMICKKLKLSQYPDSGHHHDVFSSHNLDRLYKPDSRKIANIWINKNIPKNSKIFIHVNPIFIWRMIM